MLATADFLAGALLSLLLPVLLLIALVVWYWMFLRRVPDTEPEGAANPGPGANPGPQGPAGAGSPSGEG